MAVIRPAADLEALLDSPLACRPSFFPIYPLMYYNAKLVRKLANGDDFSIPENNNEKWGLFEMQEQEWSPVFRTDTRKGNSQCSNRLRN